VDNLNKQIEGTEFAELPLEAIIRKAQGGMFNNAAQTWNHTFYWHCLKPNGGGEPTGKLKEAIDKAFGDFASSRKSSPSWPWAPSAPAGAGWCSALTARWRWSAPPTPPPR
jgi:superoxide dismutase